MSLDLVFKNLEEQLMKVSDHLKEQYAGLQIGRASAGLVERVMVDSYGTMQPLKAVASISVPDAKTIQIQPWDRSTLAAIEKAIQMSDIGLTPQNDGIVVRLNIPPLTEERRKELAKLVHKMAEEAKISVRAARQTAMDKVKSMQKTSELTEDQLKTSEKKIQEKVDHTNEGIDHSAKEKEADVMKV